MAPAVRVQYSAMAPALFYRIGKCSVWRPTVSTCLQHRGGANPQKKKTIEKGSHSRRPPLNILTLPHTHIQYTHFTTPQKGCPFAMRRISGLHKREMRKRNAVRPREVQKSCEVPAEVLLDSSTTLKAYSLLPQIYIHTAVCVCMS